MHVHGKYKGHACLSSCTRLFMFIFIEIYSLSFVFISKLSISVLGTREPGRKPGKDPRVRSGPAQEVVECWGSGVREILQPGRRRRAGK